MNYFISDIHLGLLERSKDKIIEDKLLDFLDKISGDAESLYIVGDLFDYWFEYKSVIPKYYYRTLTKLYELKQKDIKIEYLMGNHDFGHYEFFEKELGIAVHRNDVETEIEDKKFFISHGDGKANNDAGYRFLKKILRAKLSNSLYRNIHPDFGIKLAHSSSKTSRNYTGRKDYGKSEGLEEFAAKMIDSGFNYIIMGHRHNLVFKQINNGYYINLGDWLSHPHFGQFDGNEFLLRKVDDFLEE